MPKVAVFNVNGDQVGEIELDERLFGAPVRPDLMHQVVLMYLAGQRQGTHDVKGRSEVRGGGRKPWRQKGTGRARQGSTRAPQWTGGGVVFGPTPRSHKFRIPKKVRRLALYSALSSKVDDGKLLVLENLELPEAKTKHVAALLKRFSLEKALIVDAQPQDDAARSTRNIPGVKYVGANGVNVYDVLRHDTLVLTKDAIAKVQEVFA
ncbi:50S ribosomal protein L4 [Alicyclobacillus cycloheptanicus]|uniref:Large ribosomal subunit protein uL4 n=1 Tax=Alicyclobacillus cycloheptanicus TaxID=1457 RepID=A0ABT9XJB7_9BACL|nr:50S ribosomal protein L4 [Alicyclobacillus cycloheptanicus]MDQ0190405.1 large subunit ribosomal protein L4 [Alicyclobacillus cycloheptanicus]WDM02645.1 50S ribosomal protein L4 [Alicyclobacillus cycloheptanicus]